VHVEISKALNPLIYPDLIQAGGLVPALEHVLAELSSDLSVGELEEPRFIVYASVSSGLRSTQVYVEAQVRTFGITFWHQGVKYGGGWTPDLRTAGQAIILFHQRASLVEMESRFAWFGSENSGIAHERGVDEFLTEAWRSLEEFLSWVEIGPFMRRLVPVVSEAASRPALRQLLPFTSLGRLCFSRTTGYPFTRDCPLGCPIEGERFVVVAPDGCTRLGQGDAAQAADILVANLPLNCGRAVHGTADC
jgi:hypothetical protein